MVSKPWNKHGCEKRSNCGYEIPILTSWCDLGENVHVGDISTCVHGQLHSATLFESGKCYQRSLELEGDSHRGEIRADSCLSQR